MLKTIGMMMLGVSGSAIMPILVRPGGPPGGFTHRWIFDDPLKPSSTGGQYLQEWRHAENGPTAFWGEGMVYENVPKGAYWANQINAALPHPR